MRSQLTEDQRGVLQRELQSQLDAMRSRSGAVSGGMSQVDHAAEVARQDADDATQRAGDREVEDIVGDIDSGEFAALHAALLRIQSPEYGLCTDCGASIPFGRLRAEPQALRCTLCEASRERQA
jgi:DnaK suppressor protein